MRTRGREINAISLDDIKCSPTVNAPVSKETCTWHFPQDAAVRVVLVRRVRTDRERGSSTTLRLTRYHCPQHTAVKVGMVRIVCTDRERGYSTTLRLT